ncbi:MAG: hypothetical protein V3V18_01305 [Methylococcales bacterium]
MTDIEKKAEIVLNALNKSVRDALDRKKRLGQYAVVWQDKKVVRLFENNQRPRQDQ